MQIFKITKNDVKNGQYVGNLNLNNLQGNLEIDENLGLISFKNINCAGYIFAKSGSGIEAGLGIKAGEGIKAGLGIKAGEGIQAGLGIKAGLGIEAGLGIKAGLGINAGEGIKAGLGITCKKTLQATFLIFAGICTWRQKNEICMDVTCGKLVGTVAYGNVIETGIVEETTVANSMSGKEVTVIVDGVSYVAVVK